MEASVILARLALLILLVGAVYGGWRSYNDHWRLGDSKVPRAVHVAAGTFVGAIMFLGLMVILGGAIACVVGLLGLCGFIQL